MTPAAKFARAAVFALAVLAPAGATTTLPAIAYAQDRGHASPDAEAFVQYEANRVISVLQNRGMGMGYKKRMFRAEIDRVADVPKITQFVLGKYRRSLSPQQYAHFAGAFREYAYNVYESRLNAYAGQRLEVTGSVERRPGDVIVSSRIVGRLQGNARPDVQWRVIRGADGRWRAVDVNVSGVWLAIVQQQDFVSTLDNNGGNVDALISQLRYGPQGGRG